MARNELYQITLLYFYFCFNGEFEGEFKGIKLFSVTVRYEGIWMGRNHRFFWYVAFEWPHHLNYMLHYRDSRNKVKSIFLKNMDLFGIGHS